MSADLLQIAQLAATRPAEFLIASAWQGLLLTSAAWIGFKAVPKLAPRTRFVLWMIVFLLAALLPFVTLLRRPGSASAIAHAVAGLSPAHLNAGWALAFASVWLIASLVSACRLLASVYRLYRIAHTSTPVDANALSSELRSAIERSGLRRISLRLSYRIDTPMVIGFLHPMIVVPEWLWQKVTPMEMTQVVLHEVAHLERRDDWTNLLQKLFRTLFPLNPALIWAEQQLCWEREMACDDAVLDAAIAPREYASCLTNLAEKRQLRHAQALAPGAWRRRSELAERVHRILKRNRTLSALSSRPVVAGFLAVYLSAGYVLAHSPRLVTFLPPASSTVVASKGVNSQMGDEFSSERRFDTTARAIAAPRFEPASFRTAVPKSPALSTKMKANPRRASLKHREAVKRGPRVITASLIETQRPRLSPVIAGDGGIVFTLFEISPSQPAVFYSQLPAFRSSGSWIIIQL